MEEPGFSDLLIGVGVAFLARGVGGHHGDRGNTTWWVLLWLILIVLLVYPFPGWL